jgi:hypothetical protein
VKTFPSWKGILMRKIVEHVLRAEIVHTFLKKVKEKS